MNYVYYYLAVAAVALMFFSFKGGNQTRKITPPEMYHTIAFSMLWPLILYFLAFFAIGHYYHWVRNKGRK